MPDAIARRVLPPDRPRPTRVLALAGDGIGPEVTAEALRVLRRAVARHALPVEVEEGAFGLAAWKAHGALLPAASRAAEARADAVLAGPLDSLDHTAIPMEERRTGGMAALRDRLGLFVSLRPLRTDPVLAEVTPHKARVLDGVDLVFVRDLSGGAYLGQPRGIEHLAHGQRRGVDTHSYTEDQVVRTARFAFALARGRRGRVTSVDKANLMESGALWRQVVTALHEDEFRDVALEHMLADACAPLLARDPARFDVVLADSLFGDVLSAGAAALAGSPGMLPSLSLSRPLPDGRRRALYEPVHGAAPGIAGKGVANPIGAILSAALLLRWSVGAEAAAAEVEAAVAAALAGGARTADIALPGQPVVGTAAMGDAVLRGLG
ncbi:isocitrate/isopropylmalate family dehydrogenase [Falsiroseomonas sp. CW058]|uniref:isocitrate/isopropylmalate family dehydrogenase n=1 Tax=Falsiroseomonas sp. CW058 TaxID=3388664 RepID=UPI003D31CB36